ncbi:phage minor head protein [Mesorhizobium sp. AA23]|uniref:phage head morphogenesis protein n=1 Tax=Mesorhizobium sp. AA23 TaxID=1854058 RepID=UPI0009EF672F|nr:phage minor head protein [Mesorhizobium sp. AA23]
MAKRNEKALRPVRPNAGIEAAYRGKLYALIEAMSQSVLYWLRAFYRANTPRMAQDETPADALRRSIRKLAAQWTKRFDVASEQLGDYFALSVEKRSSAALRKILRDGGISVEFKKTAAMRDVIDATVNANVALIKSIPSQYFDQVEGAVMRSVQTGRDLADLVQDLERYSGITKRRAAFIALDQNNKATSAFNRARQLELGIDEAEWHHSGGGKEPRPTHVQAGREKVRYKISTGWYDPAVKRFIRPGEEPGCRCVGKPILKGFS